MRSNPREAIIYDTYVQALQNDEQFDRALQILKQAEQQIPARRENFQAKRVQIEKQKKFSREMTAAPSWDKARIFASSEFVMQTNIPQTYLPVVTQKIRGILKKEQEMLKGILGPSDSMISGMKFIVIGRPHDYLIFMKEKYHDDTGLVAGLYDEQARQMIIYFDGSADWKVIAHEMVHALIRELYYPKPSHFVDEGLAEYVSHKIEKESMKSELLDKLEYSMWLYHQGKFQDVSDLFTVWKKYERPSSFVGQEKTSRQFYLIAWSFNELFIETKDEMIRKFYRGYLAYEQSRSYNDWRSASDYFKAHLSPDQMNKLNKAWTNFLFERTYESI
ncbi:MAG: hypothetical protein EXS63_07940 [Candidatus Omnitrophica bacterium]|nr:hypothetical protein [Candidatus Omnitrophota bacterium]